MDDENFEAFEKKFDDFAGGLGDRLSAMETALASEKREREDLEIRMQRLGVGNREEKGDIVPEHKAMNAFARAGAPDWSQEVEIKAMSVGSDPDGGYVVLPVMSANMTKRLFDLSPMRQLARIETITTGDAWEEPDDRDEAGAEWVGEQSPRTETDTPQLGMIRIEKPQVLMLR